MEAPLRFTRRRQPQTLSFPPYPGWSSCTGGSAPKTPGGWASRQWWEATSLHGLTLSLLPVSACEPAGAKIRPTVTISKLLFDRGRVDEHNLDGYWLNNLFMRVSVVIAQWLLLAVVGVGGAFGGVSTRSRKKDAEPQVHRETRVEAAEVAVENRRRAQSNTGVNFMVN